MVPECVSATRKEKKRREEKRRKRLVAAMSQGAAAASEIAVEGNPWKHGNQIWSTAQALWEKRNQDSNRNRATWHTRQAVLGCVAAHFRPERGIAGRVKRVAGYG